jgi:S-adenosylmethionine hydrolase
LYSGKAVPAEIQSLENLEAMPAIGKVWFVDNFGNLKTTLRAEDIGFEEGREFTLSNGEPVACYRRLADVPKATTGLTIGSSGYGQDRFLEVVVGERGRATDVHSLTIGSEVLTTA